MFTSKHYRAIASVIRDRLERNGAPFVIQSSSEGKYLMAARNELGETALAFARMFAEDNEGFKPFVFLDACSPDPENYPLSELWDE